MAKCISKQIYKGDKPQTIMKRVSNKQAELLVKAGWQYAPKSQYKRWKRTGLSGEESDK